MSDFPNLKLIRKILIAILFATLIVFMLSSIDNDNSSYNIIFDFIAISSLHFIVMSFVRNNFFIKLFVSILSLSIIAGLMEVFSDLLVKYLFNL
jgi:hypothetical protein